MGAVLVVTTSFIISVVLASVLGSIKPALALLVPLFIGKYFFSRFSARGMTWVSSAALATFITTFLVVLVIFFVPGFFKPGIADPEAGLNLYYETSDLFFAFVNNVVVVFLKSMLLGVLIMPFIFIGDYFNSKVKGILKFKKKEGAVKHWVALFLSTYLVSLIFVLLTYAFTWIIPTLVNFIYFS